MIIDNDGMPNENKPEAQPGEDTDAPKDDINPKDTNLESQPSDDKNPDDGGEDQEAGAGGTENEVPAPEAESAPEIESLRNQISELSTKLESALSAKPQAPASAAPQVAELSDEQWRAHEEKLGVGRETIKYFTNQAVKVYQTLLEKMDEKMARYEKADALRSISRDPKFSDATKYQKDVDEYLGQFHVSQHGNPDLLKNAIYYARGKNMGKTISKVQSQVARNPKIVGAGRPSAPAPTASKPKIAMTAGQKHAASMFGEKEYNEGLALRGKAFDA